MCTLLPFYQLFLTSNTGNAYAEHDRTPDILSHFPYSGFLTYLKLLQSLWYGFTTYLLKYPLTLVLCKCSITHLWIGGSQVMSERIICQTRINLQYNFSIEPRLCKRYCGFHLRHASLLVFNPKFTQTKIREKQYTHHVVTSFQFAVSLASYAWGVFFS